jgi:hypothetical protein
MSWTETDTTQNVSSRGVQPGMQPIEKAGKRPGVPYLLEWHTGRHFKCFEIVACILDHDTHVNNTTSVAWFGGLCYMYIVQ